VKNSSDTIGDRNRDLPTCSAVPQPTALRRVPPEMSTRNISWGGKGGRCVGLTTLSYSCADCLEIWEASTCWNPLGLSRPVMGFLYLFLPIAALMHYLLRSDVLLSASCCLSFSAAKKPNSNLGCLTLEVSRAHSIRHTVGTTPSKE
jgi:hypothetical protein